MEIHAHHLQTYHPSILQATQWADKCVCCQNVADGGCLSGLLSVSSKSNKQNLIYTNAIHDKLRTIVSSFDTGCSEVNGSTCLNRQVLTKVEHGGLAFHTYATLYSFHFPVIKRHAVHTAIQDMSLFTINGNYPGKVVLVLHLSDWKQYCSVCTCREKPGCQEFIEASSSSACTNSIPMCEYSL